MTARGSAAMDVLKDVGQNFPGAEEFSYNLKSLDVEVPADEALDAALGLAQSAISARSLC
jgi:hypothetical protein